MDYQELFNHMHDEHDLILLESEMQEIIHIVNKMQNEEDYEEHKCEDFKEYDGALLFCSVCGKKL